MTHSLAHKRRTAIGALTGILLSSGLLTLALPAHAAPPVHVKLTTSAGDIRLELYPDHAPKTVANFVQYVKDKHYDGTVFHRVINNFMIQGGGFDASYAQKAARAPVPHEGREALASGGLRNTVGTIAMARTNDPQSATAQFFINVKDNAFLDPSAQSWGYTVFGKVVAGMDVVNTIKSAPTGPGGPFPSDVPKTPITLLKATLEN
jgi:peptidyl-prolyl cis-trans isomerase A (cyclophilin A)